MAGGVGFLAAVTSASELAGSGFSWWQSVGGLIAVFALLMVSLKLLGRATGRRGGAPVDVLTVWHLGPRREVQVLRLADEAHYIYRHDGAMVLLKREPLVEFQRSRPHTAPVTAARGLKRWLPGGWPFSHLAAKCADPAPDLTSF